MEITTEIPTLWLAVPAPYYVTSEEKYRLLNFSELNSTLQAHQAYFYSTYYTDMAMAGRAHTIYCVCGGLTAHAGMMCRTHMHFDTSHLLEISSTGDGIDSNHRQIHCKELDC